MHFSRSNTILYCRRWRQAVDFYRNCLNLSVHFENDWLVEFNLHGDAYVSIADAGRTTIVSAEGNGITLSLKVDDIERAHRDLSKTCGSPTAIHVVWDVRAFHIFDPEGHRIELWGE